MSSLSEWVHYDRLSSYQMSSSSKDACVVLTKEMAEGLIDYIKKQDVLYLFDDKSTIICLICGKNFIKNGGLCSCRENSPHYHNYYCLIYYKHFPDIDEVLKDINKKIRTKRRGLIRRTLLQEAEGHHNKADLEVLYKLQAGLCYYCMSPIETSGQNKYTIDHIVPLTDGGTNWPINIALSCISCNLRKSWASERKFIYKIRSDKSDAWIEEHKEFISFIKNHKKVLYPKSIEIY